MPDYSILLLAGEASGDYHAAALIRDLKALLPEITVAGIGGDKLAQAGMHLFHHYKEVNTMGLSEGLGKVRNILSAYNTMKKELRSGRYHLFIPVDFPDVNLRLCRFARDAGVPVCYYISPQVWAWRKGRVRKIAARVDRMMTLFPFEETFYRNAGINADFVGHTMVGHIPDIRDKSGLRRELGVDESRYTVALVPGSRPAEVLRMLPRMCRAAEIFVESYPDAQFILPLAGEHLSQIVADTIGAHGVPVGVYSSEAAQIMAAADCGLVTSGTATLQAALAGMPHAVVYVIDAFTWWFILNIIKPLLMDKDVHVAIANVLAIESQKNGRGPIGEMLEAGIEIPCQECGRPLFVPEILQHEATPDHLAAWLLRFRSDQVLCDAMHRGFAQIRHMLSPPSEEKKPAHIIRQLLETSSATSTQI